MKITPIYIATHTGLTESSVRRRVIAVAKKKGKRGFKYSREMNLNGLSIATLEDIAASSRDEESRTLATELLQSIQSGSELKPVKDEALKVQSTWTHLPECNATGMSDLIASEMQKFNALDEVKEVKQKYTFNALYFIESHLLTAINVIDIILVFAGLTLLYGSVGIALASMGSMFFVKAQIIARNPQLRQSNDNAIQVVGWMCGITFILHSITFWNAMDFGLVDLDGNAISLINNTAKVVSALGPAAFVSILAYKAVETEHKIAKEKFRAENGK